MYEMGGQHKLKRTKTIKQTEIIYCQHKKRKKTKEVSKLRFLRPRLPINHTILYHFFFLAKNLN